MSSGTYEATCPVLSQAQAEEFGRWLALYEIRIGGLQVWQIMPDGSERRDNAAAATVTDVARSAATSAVTSGPAGAAAVAMGCSLLGPWAMVGALVALVATIRIRADYALHKRLPGGAGPAPVATRLVFGLADVSDKRRKWTEYLIGIYAHKHGWTDVRGFAHPEQLAAGARAAGYPLPWSQQTRRRAKGKGKPQGRMGRLRGWLEEL